MPTDRVLIEIVTAANMAGVEQAKAGLLGFNPAALGVGLALGGLIMAGKSAIDISREHAQAEKALAIAIKDRGQNSKAVEDELSSFMKDNRDYISNQADVITSTAALVRQGTSLTDIQRDQNLILDLAAAKTISLADATEIVLKAQSGQFRGLKDILGLTTEAIPKTGSLADKEQAVADNMNNATAAVKGARDQIDPLQKASNDLTNDWTDLANKAGPPLVGILDQIAKSVDHGYTKLDELGKDDALWGKIQDRLMKLEDLPIMAFLLSGKSADLSNNATMNQLWNWVHGIAAVMNHDSGQIAGFSQVAGPSRQRGFIDSGGNFTS